ncbi:MAG: hypothetical protein MI922_08125, partial [Bacteroidales bacterium]|nr:hypothetical protein [Bacteroidales bacterium]
MIKSFPSKILLFGEYGVLYGAKALAIPYEKYSGQFIFKSNYIDNRLKELCTNLIARGFSSILKLDEFEKDIINGIKFSSTIPQSSGLGSSGALVAALFDRYAYEAVRNYSTVEIKDMMAGIESYYHISSSGIDPMVSFAKKALLLSENRISTVDLNLTTLPSIRFFVVNSDIEGSTHNGMKLFKEKLMQTSFLDEFKSFYKDVSDKTISA